MERPAGPTTYGMALIAAVIALFVALGVAVDRIAPNRSGDEPEPR